MICPQGMVREKEKFGVQLGPACMHPRLAEAPTYFGLLVAPNRLPRANHKKCLTLFCTRDNPKRLQNTPSGDIQAVSKQDKISFTNSISKGRSHQAPDLVDANFISWGQQSVHSGVD